MSTNRHRSTLENAKTLYFTIHISGPITKEDILAETGLTPGQYATAFAFLRDGLDARGVPINYDASDHTYSIPTAVDWEMSRDYQIRRLRILIKQQERVSKHCIASSKHHPQMSTEFLSASNQTLKSTARLEAILGGLIGA